MKRAAIPRKSASPLRTLFAAGFYCAESVVMAIAKAEGGSTLELLPKLCDRVRRRDGPDVRQLRIALTGATSMAVGLALGRSAPTESVEPTFTATRRLIHDFEREFGARDCQGLLGGCGHGHAGRSDDVQ